MTVVTLGTSSNGNFVVKYENSQAVAQGMAQTILNICESDFSSLSDWFGVTGFGSSDHITVTVQPISSGGANNFGYQSGGNTTINVGIAGGTQASLNATAPMLFVAELAEVFMSKKWNGTIFNYRHSDGEGLSQFCALSLHHNGYYSYYGSSWCDSWLKLNPRPDWVSQVENTDGNAVSFGCSLMFLYFLRDQLGFTIKEIILNGGTSLEKTYQNLTGDLTHPFDFFSLLVDSIFPVGQAITGIGAEAENDPFPLFLFQFGGNKTSFSKSEVSNSITNNLPFKDSLRLQLQGCSPFTWNAFFSPVPAQPSFAPGQLFPGMHFSQEAPPIFQNSALQRAPQILEFSYDVTWDGTALPAFTTAPQVDYLDSSITIAGKPALTSQIPIVFYGAEDPYILTYAPNADNQPWLAYDLRVFSALGGSQPVPGLSQTVTSSTPGAYSYIQALLKYLSTNFGNAGGIDPFDPNNNIIPGQSGALTGDSSVIPTTGFLGISGLPVYNFAVARVRLNGPVGTVTNGPVRVFFRLWESQRPDTTYYDTTTYNSHKDALNLPDYPLAAPDDSTTPYFATNNYVNINFSDANNSEYGQKGGANSQIITINYSQGQWAYFGCYLNVYDPSNTYNGTAITNGLLPGTHHCLVAQIAYDDAPVEAAPGSVTWPGQSDKLVQRNLSISPGYNPGLWPTNIIPQTFSVPPTSPAVLDSGLLFDELRIDWGQIPKGTIASIYWPGADASAVIAMADSKYAYHNLTAADAHTIQTPVIPGPTYIPIPILEASNLAGLLTLELPPMRRGNTYTAVIKRVTGKAIQPPIEVAKIRAAETTSSGDRETTVFPSAGEEGHAPGPTPAQPSTSPLPPQNNPGTSSYRLTTGGFQVNIPIQADEQVLPYDEETLSIMKYRLSVMKKTNIWYPVLTRYIEILSERIDGHGGTSSAIPPSQTGLKNPPKGPGRGGHCGCGDNCKCCCCRHEDDDGCKCAHHKHGHHSHCGDDDKKADHVEEGCKYEV